LNLYVQCQTVNICHSSHFYYQWIVFKFVMRHLIVRVEENNPIDHQELNRISIMDKKVAQNFGLFSHH
jgi:hypothetical protein